MNTAFDQLYGNEKIKKKWMSELSARTLSHAYILEGPSGSGKNLLSDLLAAGVGCREASPPCGRCESCRKILSHIAPDIVYLGLAADKKTVGVEAVRELREQAFIKPTELDYRFFIIEDAGVMTPAAQNALLLLLEEPPAGVYFLLHCENARWLLPTIRSRAPVLRMQQFTPEELREYLLSNVPELASGDPAALDFAVRNAGGTVGKALYHLEHAAKKENDDGISASVLTFLERLCSRQGAELTAFLSTLNLPRDRAILFMQELESALRDITVVKYCAAPVLLFFSEAARASLYADRLTGERVAAVFSAVTEAKYSITANAHVGTALTLLSGRIRRIFKEV